MKNLFILLFVVLCLNIYSQSVNFKGEPILKSDICNTLSFNDNYEAKAALDKICNAAGLINNYILIPCPNIGTCIATVRDGIPIISYDNIFLEKIKSYGFSEKRITNTNINSIDWSSLTILAHELGHHVNQHFSTLRSSLEFIKQNEIEADEFAGSTLYKLGATLDQIKAVYNTLDEQASNSHPSRVARLEAVEKGYNSASSKFSFKEKNYNSVIVGNWQTKNTVISFYSNNQYEAFDVEKFVTGYWNITNGNLNLNNNSTKENTSFIITDLSNYALTLKIKGQNITLSNSSISAKNTYNEYIKNNIDNFINLKGLQYTYRNAGGIWDVKIPVSNNSDRNFKSIKIFVEYYLSEVFSSGKLYKKEMVEIKDLKARSKVVVTAPNSERGVKLKLTIADIIFAN